MGEARDLRKMTMDEYLELDRRSEEKWEFVDGEVFAMAGASPVHNVVAGNLYMALRRGLGERPCIALQDGQKLSTPTTRSHHYPDALVVCGPLARDVREPNAITNPTLIVEVLSSTTADYDRGGKLVRYRTIPSFTDYLLIDPEERKVEHHRRIASNQWLMTEYSSGAVALESIDVTITLEELWVDVERVAASQ
jgi:Uma2 family endonuclease